MRALLCPGQGAQYVGMGRDVAERWPQARAIFDQADEALSMHLSRTLFEGSAEEVNRTDICQPGILTVSAAILEALRAEGRVDDSSFGFAAGLSLGEYTAHYVAGTFPFEDAVRLVRRRGQFMQEASDAAPSGMAAVIGADLEAIEEVCGDIRADGGICVVANLNCPGQVVVSGDAASLDRCEEAVAARGAKRFLRLKVAGAFHSPLMQPAADRLAEELTSVGFADPAFPVISNVTGEPVRTADEARDTLARQVTSPVYFERSLRLLIAEGVGGFVEPGPGRALAGFVRKIDRALPVEGYDNVADVVG